LLTICFGTKHRASITALSNGTASNSKRPKTTDPAVAKRKSDSKIRELEIANGNDTDIAVSASAD
jgi:hypothetical protein